MKAPRQPLPDLSLEQLQNMMMSLGVKRLLMKPLAPNDNSKNQPYLSGSLDVLNTLPAGEVYSTLGDKGNEILKAALPLEWLQPDGTSIPAPNAKLILYPQYPEVRFSGFLLGAVNAPGELLTTRQPGRLLFFGLTEDRRIIGWASGPENLITLEVAALGELEMEGVFRILPLAGTQVRDSLDLLLEQLRRVHLLDWIDSKRMSKGLVTPYNALNGIGYTLEAELGVSNNGSAEPDFEGWEVKASQAKTFLKVPASKKITLMTPEPDGGEYSALDLPDFIRKFGYPDRNGVPDRLNFGGTFKVGRRHGLTKLTTVLTGFDPVKGEVTDPGGKLALITDDDREAMSWSFKKLLTHWNKKHAKAVYVPGELRKAPSIGYRYGPRVTLGEGTEFNMLLKLIAAGHAHYDPGIKLENASSAKPTRKGRSQFRIPWKHVPSLYFTSREQDLF